MAAEDEKKSTLLLGDAWANLLGTFYGDNDVLIDQQMGIHTSFFLFQCKHKPDPTMTIKSYINRILRHCRLSFGALMHAIVYLSRFHAQYGDPKKAPNYFPLNTFTLHRLVLTSCLVAAKFYDDSYFKNAFFARVGGVDKDHINHLEVEFCYLTGFHFATSVEESNLVIGFTSFFCRKTLRGEESLDSDTVTPMQNLMVRRLLGWFVFQGAAGLSLPYDWNLLLNQSIPSLLSSITLTTPSPSSTMEKEAPSLSSSSSISTPLKTQDIENKNQEKFIVSVFVERQFIINMLFMSVVNEKTL